VGGGLITFEGIEGSGKSTQLARVAAELRDRGLDPLVTREPGGTPLGRTVRAALLAPDAGSRARSPLTEALLMVADRHEHVATLVGPALAAGRVVLCDRHADSTLAYQGGGSGVALATLRALNAIAVGAIRPALTLLFDLPVQQALSRMADRATRAEAAADRFEAETLAFHERVRGAYLELAAGEPERIAVIDAARPADDVYADVRVRVLGVLAPAS
jgi:dTMP kinase